MTADIKRYRENLRDELNGSELYAAFAAITRQKFETRPSLAPSTAARWHGKPNCPPDRIGGHWSRADPLAEEHELALIARQLIFGCLAAGVTYGIGSALGTSLS
jgi:hypothetical protein